LIWTVSFFLSFLAALGFELREESAFVNVGEEIILEEPKQTWSILSWMDTTNPRVL
jgi:hypothetical protein